jgi:hypothetical protein
VTNAYGRSPNAWGDAMDFNSLLGRTVFDPFALAERVLQQVQDQLAHDETFTGFTGAKPPDELLAIALGNRLARMIAKEEPLVGSDRSTVGRRDDELADYEELVDRDNLLAAALGACVCWGQRAECPICNGAGTPGWALPDEQLYTVYVRPAVIAATTHHGSVAATASGAGDRKESGDA